MMDKLLSEKHNIKLSKSLSWLLRHNLNLVYPFLESEEEIEVAKTTGFIDCQAILKHHHLRNYSIEQIKEVCTLNDKQRFTIRQHPESPDKMQIRANQGHTIKSINVDMKKFHNADEIHHDVIHGTYRKCWRAFR
jgi:RNA:NAD 2'-phosphotransferase (TPT1/KptA family)